MTDSKERIVRLVYFAWVRERIGVGEEERVLPENLSNVADLLAWLPSLGKNYELAMTHAHALRVALDQEIVENNAPLGTPREIAIFPPMTGG